MAKDNFITLGCIYSRGRYTKVVTPRHKHGLKFIDGQLKMLESEYDTLKKENNDFQLFLQKGEIFRVLKGSPSKNPSIPKVVHGASTVQGAGVEVNNKKIAVHLDTESDEKMPNANIDENG